MSDSRGVPLDNPPTLSGDLKPGDWIAGRFKIARVIGQGGFGTVYEAHQESMGRRRVALKILSPRRHREQNAVQRFRQEALLASRLHHPNTITLFDFGTTQLGLLYIAMEYLEGEPLGSVLKHQGALALHRADHIARQVLGSLAEAHAIGLIHRDLKPDNIFLTRIFGEPDFVKVLDFGLAKMEDDVEYRHSAIGLPAGGRVDLTMEGLVCGTPDYMAPEQAQGVGPLSAAVDVYAVGLLIYHMLTGRKPFIGEGAVEVLKLQVNAPMPLLPASMSQHRLARLMEVATRKRPEDRYPDASAMLQALVGTAPIEPRGAQRQTLSRTTSEPDPPQMTQPHPMAGFDVEVNLQQQTNTDMLAPTPNPAPPVGITRSEVVQVTTGSVPSPTGQNPRVEEPTASHRALGAEPMPALLTGQVPMVGREQELRQILSLLRQTVDSGQSHMMLVQGEAGIGKSRLLTEASRIIQETSDVMIAGGYFRNSNADPDEALARLVGHLLRLTPEQAAEMAHAGLLQEHIKAYLNHYGVQLSSRDMSLVTGLLTPGMQPAGPSPTRHTALILERLVRWILKLAEAQPLVLVFEDLQAADPTSLDLMRRLTTSIARNATQQQARPQTRRRALCMLMTLRRDDAPQRGDVLRLIGYLETLPRQIAPMLSIEGLEDEASTQLVGALLPADQELRRRVTEIAHGNPLHMVQILHHLYERDRLNTTTEPWQLRDDKEPLELPQKLSEMVRLRISSAVSKSSAPEAMKELLHRLAVLGRRVPQGLLTQALKSEARPWPSPLLGRLLAELKVQRLLSDERDGSTQPDIQFDNGMIPEVLMQEIEGTPQGAALHRAAADAKQAFYDDGTAHAHEIAAHLTRAGEPGRALPYLLESGQRRQDLGDLQGALNQYQSAETMLGALSHNPPPPELLARLWLSTGYVHMRLGNYGPAEHYLNLSVESAQNTQEVDANGLMAGVWLHMGQLRLLQKRTEDATKHLQEARQFAIAQDDVATQMEATILLGELALEEGIGIDGLYLVDFEERLETLASQEPLLKARGLQHLGVVALTHGDNLNAERYLARARLIVDEIGPPDVRGPISSDLGYALLLQGRTAEGEGLLREAHQIYRELGDRLALSICLHRLGMAAWHRLAMDEALEQLHQALDIQREIQVPGHTVETLSLVGRVQEARGCHDQAAIAYREALETIQSPVPEARGDLHLRLGVALMGNHQIDASRRALETASQLFENAANTRRRVQCINLLAMASSWRGEKTQAVALLEKSEELARQSDDVAGQIFALTALALLASQGVQPATQRANRMLTRAQGLYHQHQTGPEALIHIVALILEGHTHLPLHQLPTLQQAWLQHMMSQPA